MAKSSIEKAIEKQQKESKKLAEQEARRNRASVIVSGQPIIGSMRIMDAASEEVFTVLLSLYDGNGEREISGNRDAMPTAYRNSLSLEFEKLKMYGMISSSHFWMDGTWEATLTPQGITYFEDKIRAQQNSNGPT